MKNTKVTNKIINYTEGIVGLLTIPHYLLHFSSCREFQLCISSLCETETIIGRRDGKSIHFYTSVLKC